MKKVTKYKFNADRFYLIWMIRSVYAPFLSLFGLKNMIDLEILKEFCEKIRMPEQATKKILSRRWDCLPNGKEKQSSDFATKTGIGKRLKRWNPHLRPMEIRAASEC